MGSEIGDNTQGSRWRIFLWIFPSGIRDSGLCGTGIDPHGVDINWPSTSPLTFLTWIRSSRWHFSRWHHHGEDLLLYITMRIAAAALFFALGADSFQPSGLSRWSGTQLGIGGIPEHLPPMHIPPLAKIPPFQPRVSLSDMKIPDIDWKSADAQAALNEAGRLLRERSDVFSSKIGEFAYRDPEISVSFPFEKLEASLKAATRLSEYSSLKDLLDAMNMNELGGYYAAAVIFVLLVVGKSQNKNSFVARVPLTPVSSSNIQALTDQVAQLKEATASLEEEISALRDEKATVDAELSSMKGEVESLLGLVKAAQSNEDELRTALKVAQGNYDVEVGALRQQLGEAKAKLPKPHVS